MQVSLFPPLMFSLFPFFVVLPTMCPRTLRFLRSTPLLFWSAKTPFFAHWISNQEKGANFRRTHCPQKSSFSVYLKMFFFRGQVCRGVSRANLPGVRPTPDERAPLGALVVSFFDGSGIQTSTAPATGPKFISYQIIFTTKFSIQK